MLTAGDTLAGLARRLAGGVPQGDAVDASFVQELAQEAWAELARGQPENA
jgi:hypothetical protein